MLEERARRSRQFAKLRVISTQSVDRLGIVPLETFHDGAKRLANPPHERGVDEKKKNQGKGKKRKDEPLARAVEFLDHRRLVADDKLGERGSVPTRKRS